MIKTLEDLYKVINECSPYPETNGHWQSPEPINPEGLHGFAYCVKHKETQKLYIGRKGFFTGGRKTRTNAAGKRVKNSRFGAETNWKSYTTSSNHINDIIEEDGKGAFDFYIIEVYGTKGGISYREPNLMHKLDVLTARSSDGERLFYNGNIPAVKFIPADYIDTESKPKFSEVIDDKEEE